MSPCLYYKTWHRRALKSATRLIEQQERYVSHIQVILYFKKIKNVCSIRVVPNFPPLLSPALLTPTSHIQHPHPLSGNTLFLFDKLKTIGETDKEFVINVDKLIIQKDYWISPCAPAIPLETDFRDLIYSHILHAMVKRKSTRRYHRNYQQLPLQVAQNSQVGVIESSNRQYPSLQTRSLCSPQ